MAGGAGNSANPPEPRTEGEGSGTTPPVLPAINGDLVIDRNGTTLADILLGRRPAADADLGRTGSGSGIAAPVFQRRYRLGTSSNAAVCAPADLQTQAAASGSEAPPCAAAK